MRGIRAVRGGDRGRTRDGATGPGAGYDDALHVRHDRPAEGGAPRRGGGERCGQREPRRLRRAGGDVHLCTGPLYHAAPLAFSLGIPLAFGATVVLMDHWDAEEALRLIDEHGVTHTHMVPTMFHRLLSLPDDVRATLRHVEPALRAARRGALPGAGEAADDRVARPDRLASTTPPPKGSAASSTPRRGSTAPGHGRAAVHSRARSSSATTTATSCRPARSGSST